MSDFKRVADLPSRDLIRDAHDLIAKALYARFVRDGATLTFDRDELEAVADSEFEIDVDCLVEQKSLTFRKVWE